MRRFSTQREAVEMQRQSSQLRESQISHISNIKGTMIELDTLYNEDCLEGMKQIPDGTIDAVICDLPYGTMKGAALKGWDDSTTAWDECIPTMELFDQYERILRKDGVAILFSQEPYTSHLRNFKYRNSNFPFAYPLIWKKDSFGNNLMANKAPVFRTSRTSAYSISNTIRISTDPSANTLQRCWSSSGKTSQSSMQKSRATPTTHSG